jgi:hypothetical protein
MTTMRATVLCAVNDVRVDEIARPRAGVLKVAVRP